MAIELNVNTYGLADEARAYFNDSLRADEWKALSTGVANAALIEAFRYMQRLNWLGVKTGGDSQTPEWPRNGDTEVPEIIKQAQFEIAIRLASDPTLIDSITDQTTSNIKRVKAEGVETEFFAPTTGSALFAWVSTLIGDLLSGGAGSGTVRGPSTSGVCDPDCDSKYGKSQYGTTVL